MDFGIAGKVALVAGSSRGIGRAVAESLAAEGVNLGLCARSEGPLRAAAREIAERFGVKTVAVPCDLSTPKGAALFISKARSSLGEATILVTNAGGPPPGNFESMNEADWLGAFNLTLMSTVRLAREALPAMRRARWGRIVNIASISVKQPVDGLLLSNALRGAVVGMAKTLSREAGGDGILVNNVCPGYTFTDRLRALAEGKARESGRQASEVLKEWAERTPLGRIGEPTEIAALAAFLCSQKASYITGTTTCVDGGHTAGIL
jgi:3-oxoacyl-[acyl-carrier protein] reductase